MAIQVQYAHEQKAEGTPGRKRLADEHLVERAVLEHAEVRVARAEHVQLAIARSSSAGADGRVEDVVVGELGVVARVPHVAVALAAHVRRRVRVQARLLVLVLLATARNSHATR